MVRPDPKIKGSQPWVVAAAMGHRSNNYSESKRNDHLDNNRRQEQRNKGIPNKSHPNFREEHKSFSSIFVSNIPWNASVQDLWDICNKWGVSFNSYAKAVLGNKSVDMSGKYDTSNARAEYVGVSDYNKSVVFLAKLKILRLLGDVLGFGWNSTLGSSGKRQDFKGVKKDIFGVSKDVSHDFIPDERCVWIDLVGLPLASWAPEVYKKLGGRWGSSVFTDMVSDGPMSHGKFGSLTEVSHGKEFGRCAGEILGVLFRGDCG
ncbi:RNA-directed DNA polymerase, eukaryota [Tanacetum coccineum]